MPTLIINDQQSIFEQIDYYKKHNRKLDAMWMACCVIIIFISFTISVNDQNIGFKIWLWAFMAFTSMLIITSITLDYKIKKLRGILYGEEKQ